MSPLSQQPQHTRRPSLNARISGHEIASQNSTLNRFMGGRQKSWMLSTNPAPAPAIPTNSTQTRHPLPQKPPKPGAASALPVPAPRNERTKEKPAADIESGCTPTTPGPVASLSSAEVLPISPVSVEQSYPPGRSSASNSPHIPNSQAEQPSTCAPTNDQQLTVLPSPNPSHGSSTRATSESVPHRDFPAACQRMNPPSPQQALQQQSIVGQSVNMTVNPPVTATNTAIYPPQSISQATSIQGTSGTSDPHRDKRARTTTESSPAGQDFRLPNGHSVNGSRPTPGMARTGQRTANPQPSPQLSLKALIPRVDQLPRLPNSVESRRAVLLRTACDKQDWFYIALHQIYCLDPSFLAASFHNFGTRQMDGINIVSDLLVNNSTLSEQFVRACAEFPASIETMIHNVPRYTGTLGEVMRFLGLLSDRWPSFEATIISRRYPPLVIGELLQHLALPSLTLQYIIFVACCRRIGGPRPDSTIQIFSSVFHRNQQLYDHSLSRMNTSDPVPPSQIQADEANIRKMYEQIRDQKIPTIRQPSQNQGLGQSLPQHMSGTQAPNQNLHRPPIQRTMSASQVQVQDQINQILQQQPRQHVSPYPPIQSQGRRRRPASQAQPRIQRTQSLQQPANQQIHRQVNWQHPATASHIVQQQSQSGQTSFVGRPPNGLHSIQQEPGVRSPTSFVPPVPLQHVLPPNDEVMFASGLPPYPTPQAHPNTVTPQSTSGHSNQGITPQSTSGHSNQGTLLLPPLGFMPTTVNPNPLVVGLHQAHLRETTRALGASNEPPELLYFLRSFAIPPSSITSHPPILKWQFMVSPEKFRKLPTQLPSEEHGPKAWGVLDGFQSYQLRCTKLAPQSQPPPEHQWAVLDTAWPTAIYVHVNGTEHFVRRKAQHGRDLPLNISSSIKEGLNEISLTLLWSSTEFNKSSYHMALEVLEYAEHKRVRAAVQHLPLAASVGQLKERLTCSNNDDDELTVIDDHITIDLIDPFMARILNTPARGKYCSHMECFDLETYLSTRLSRAKKGHGMAEDWKCPICGNDSRPQSLIIDDFLLGVRCKLEEVKLLDTKAILVGPDGTWEPRVEGQKRGESSSLKRKRGVSDEHDSVKAESPSTSRAASSSHPPNNPSPEIIELD
ncbi:hypothetical protein FQN50_002634 [Emmonsiellopsis sp. PD_5]|nr:hypothetical protein FQN50_002634 [Emmonsiellopsis sp. PD_5]